MAVASVIEIADAIVAVLNGATLSRAFTARRAYMPVRGLEDYLSLKVTVVPSSLSVQPFDLDTLRVFEWDFGVWIQQQASGDPAAIDPLMALSEGIIDLFSNWQVGASPHLRIVALGVGQSPDADRLLTDGLFTTVVTLTVRVTR
jgi:hypothetical protein